MDVRLQEIASKAAGTYFIVTDKSATVTQTAASKLRLFPINVEKGVTNTIVVFAKGDKTGFQAIFGKTSRIVEKRGNFSIQSCLDALDAGPIAVINLRKFEDIDLIGICGVDSNPTIVEAKTTPYADVFNTNSLWTIKPKNIVNELTDQHVLNFANVGNKDVSIFVVVSKNASELTNQSELSLANCTLEIDEYPGLDFEMLLKNTFVDIYVFNNTFAAPTVSTNKYYGHLFDVDGNIDLDNLFELSQIPESGFSRVVTGSLIPNLVNETDTMISIDAKMNSFYAETGIIAFINDEVLEEADKQLIDFDGGSYYGVDGEIIPDQSPYMLSHVVPEILTETEVPYPPMAVDIAEVTTDLVNMATVKISDTEFIAVLETGIKAGDKFVGVNGSPVDVVGIEVLESGVFTPDDALAKFRMTLSQPLTGGIVQMYSDALLTTQIVSGTLVNGLSTVYLKATPTSGLDLDKYIVNGVNIAGTSFVANQNTIVSVSFKIHVA